MAVRHKTSNRYDTNLGRNTMGIKFVTISRRRKVVRECQTMGFGFVAGFEGLLLAGLEVFAINSRRGSTRR